MFRKDRVGKGKPIKQGKVEGNRLNAIKVARHNKLQKDSLWVRELSWIGQCLDDTLSQAHEGMKM